MTIKRVILFVLAGCCLSLLVLRWPFHEEKPWKKTLLIINYNHPHYETIPFLKKIYEKDFPNIVFYGEKPFDGVETVDHYHGWFGQRVIEHAMRKWPNYAGYLMINDDCLVNYWNLRRLNPKKIWLVPASTFRLEQNSSEWCWWHCPFGYQAAEPAYRALPLEFSKKLQRNLGPQNVRAGMADVVYIPQKCRSRFLSMCPLFNDVFLEIGIPTMAACLNRTDTSETMRGVFLWGNERPKYQESYSPDIDFLHPVKFSDPACQKFAEEQIKKYGSMN